jgi:hypothetical protein
LFVALNCFIPVIRGECDAQCLVSFIIKGSHLFIYIFQAPRRVSTAVAAVPESSSSPEGSAVQTSLQAARSVEKKSYYVTLRQFEVSQFYCCGNSIFFYSKIHLKSYPVQKVLQVALLLQLL